MWGYLQYIYIYNRACYIRIPTIRSKQIKNLFAGVYYTVGVVN